MRTTKLLAVLVLLACSGCAAVGGFLNPPIDPRLAQNQKNVHALAANDKIAHPENAAKDDGAVKLSDDLVDPKSAPIDPPAIVTNVGESLLSVPGLAAIGGILVAVGGLWSSLRNRGVITAQSAAIDQHATLLDAVTPATAASAARTTVVPVATVPPVA